MKLSTASKLGRVSNLPTVWSNVLAGYVLAGGQLAPRPLVLLGLMGSAFYIGGMFLNDVFDVEYDLRERPERPIPAGEVERDEVLRWAAALIAGGLWLAWQLGLAVLLAALATVAFIVLYNRNHKGNPAAPVLMAMCRVGLYACAGAAAGTTTDPGSFGALGLGALVLAGYVLGLTYAARYEDSSALVRVGPLVGIAGPLAVYGSVFLQGPLGVALVVGFGLWLARALRLVRGQQPGSIRSGVIALIAGIAWVDALALASVAGTGVGLPLALGALAAFMATLALQRLVSGT